MLGPCVHEVEPTGELRFCSDHPLPARVVVSSKPAFRLVARGADGVVPNGLGRGAVVPGCALERAVRLYSDGSACAVEAPSPSSKTMAADESLIMMSSLWTW